MYFFHLETIRSTEVEIESLLHQKKEGDGLWYLLRAALTWPKKMSLKLAPTMITTIPTALKTTPRQLRKVKKD